MILQKEYVKVNHKGKYVRSIEYITKDILAFKMR